MIRAFVFCLAGVALACFGVNAWAHNAPTGWAYSTYCCSGKDCAEVPTARITATPEGWHIELLPGDHDKAPNGWSETVSYGDKRINRSGDQFFHICFYSASLRCLYVPDMAG